MKLFFKLASSSKHHLKEMLKNKIFWVFILTLFGYVTGIDLREMEFLKVINSFLVENMPAFADSDILKTLGMLISSVVFFLFDSKKSDEVDGTQDKKSDSLNEDK